MTRTGSATVTSSGSIGLQVRPTAGDATPWIVATMTCLAMLGAALAIALAPVANRLSAEIAGRATVQVIEPDPVARAAAVRLLQRELALAPYVSSIRIVPESELQDMAAQWLGGTLDDGNLPLPALIDIDLLGERDASMQRLTATVTRLVPGARTIDHADWLGPAAQLLSRLGWLAAVLAVFLIACVAGLAVLAARAALASHSATIRVLHLVGATDMQIARVFQRAAGRQALFGAALGAIAAVLILFGIRAQTSLIGLAGMDSGSTDARIALTLLIPLSVVLVAMLSVRFAILKTLRSEP